MSASGNTPPWVLPAKSKYLTFDMKRVLNRCGNPPLRVPKDLMSAAHTMIPLRALHFIKRTYPGDTFNAALLYLFHSFWAPPNQDLTQPDGVVKALLKTPTGFAGVLGPSKDDCTNESRLFTEEEVQTIIKAATSQDYKDLLKATTQEAVDRGAFGAPWLWVTNASGVSEPFFGSDRFNYICNFLELPFQNIDLLPPTLQPCKNVVKAKM